MNELYDKIEKLHAEGKSQEIVELIEKEENINDDLISILARAYNNLKNYKKAKELLLSVEDSQKDLANWNYRLGYSYLFLEEECKAIEYLAEAINIDESFKEDCDELIEFCYRKLSTPFFKENFKIRVKLFWQKFLEIEQKLRNEIDEKGLNDEIFNIMDEATDILGEEIYVEIGKSDKYEIIFLLSEEYHRIFLYDYLIEKMLDSLKENWRFILGKQPSQNMALKIYGKYIAPDDIKFKINQNEGNSMTITLYSEKLNEYDESKKDEIMILYLETILGDVGCYEILKYIKISEEDFDGIGISKLPEKLKELGINISNNYKKITSEHSVYNNVNPNGGEDANLRADIIKGTTKTIEILNEYYDAINYIMNDLHNFGASAGYLIFKSSITEGKLEDIISISKEIENKIEQNSEKSGIILGEALGINYSYIDFMAYDLEQFLETVTLIFEEKKVNLLGYLPFRKGCNPTRLI